VHIIAIGGSDAGISAALRARELEPAPRSPWWWPTPTRTFSICGIPYYVSGEVTHWRNLAHRTIADLEATGMGLRLDTVARRIDVEGRKLAVTGTNGDEELLSYDELVVVPARVPVRPPIDGLTGPDAVGADGGVHLLHSWRHLRRHANARGAQPGQCPDRGGRVHRPRDGRGAGSSRLMWCRWSSSPKSCPPSTPPWAP